MEVVTRTWDFMPAKFWALLPASRSLRKAKVVKATAVVLVAKPAVYHISMANEVGKAWECITVPILHILLHASISILLQRRLVRLRANGRRVPSTIRTDEVHVAGFVLGLFSDSAEGVFRGGIADDGNNIAVW